MLVWATEFPAASGTHADDLLPVAKEWLVGSPHSKWTHGDFADEPLGEVTRYSVGEQSVSIMRVHVDGQSWAGLQQSWIEKASREWSTDIVAHENHGVVWISVRLHCNLLKPGSRLPIPKKPYLVKLLLQKLGGGYDGILPIDEKPVLLREDEVDVAAGYMLGTAKNRLPVVYVSTNWARQYPVDISRLAKDLAGMAHVVAEPSRQFSFSLYRSVRGINAYNGAISIYWPAGLGAQARFLPGRFGSPDEFENAVKDAVRIALTHIRPKVESTWSYLREMISRARLEHLRAQGSEGWEEYAQELDVELSAVREQLADSEAEIRRLMSDNLRLQSFVRPSTEGVLTYGKEQELYPGELKECIIDALTASRNAIAPDSRWMHIIEDLIEANPVGDGAEQLATEIKAIFSKYTKFAAAERRRLEDLGFTVTDSGKHAKAVYHDDDRYVFSISKTPSDSRAGKNMASTMINKVIGYH
jgi:hypothetical protein